MKKLFLSLLCAGVLVGSASAGFKSYITYKGEHEGNNFELVLVRWAADRGKDTRNDEHVSWLMQFVNQVKMDPTVNLSLPIDVRAETYGGTGGMSLPLFQNMYAFLSTHDPKQIDTLSKALAGQPTPGIILESSDTLPLQAHILLFPGNNPDNKFLTFLPLTPVLQGAHHFQHFVTFVPDNLFAQTKQNFEQSPCELTEVGLSDLDDTQFSEHIRDLAEKIDAAQYQVKTCAACGKTDSEDAKFTKRCSKCKQVYYCSDKCVSEHFRGDNGHAKTCNK